MIPVSCVFVPVWRCRSWALLEFGAHWKRRGAKGKPVLCVTVRA